MQQQPRYFRFGFGSFLISLLPLISPGYTAKTLMVDIVSGSASGIQQICPCGQELYENDEEGV